jgi:hypothetical protein
LCLKANRYNDKLPGTKPSKFFNAFTYLRLGEK